MTQTLLVIGYVWPEPTSSAAGSRVVQLLQWGRTAGYRVVFGSAAEPGDNSLALAGLGVECQGIALNCSSFDAWVTALQPALVIFDRFLTEEQFGWRVADAWPAALRMLDTEDLHCLRAGREQALKAGRPVLELQDQDLYNDLAQRELASIYRCDLSLVISDAELQLLRERFQVPAELLLWLPFMEPALTAPPADFASRRHLVFIGNYRHGPNWDAVRYLREFWPAIRARLPGVELHLYGAYQPKKALQLHSEPLGFLVRGWARDARATLGAYRLCLAPLRFGAGIKGKLADAWAAGTPSVTTAIGAEGMGPAASWPGALAEQPAELVQAVLSLYGDESRWQRAQAEGLTRFQQLFDARQLGLRLHNKVDALTRDLPAHRLRNIVGSILHEQKHRATEFMSRWIEVKSR